MSAQPAGGLCLVFDLDDTLYPEASYARGGLQVAGSYAERELGLNGFGRTLLDLFDSGRRGDLFDAGLIAHGRAAEQATVARLVEAYRTHTPQLALFEDAALALEHYGGRLPLGLITDGFAAVQQAKVTALGLAARLPTIVLTDTIGGRATWKPSPAGFQAVERAMGTATSGGATRFAYVADNLAKDFIAPNARGWMTIRIVRPAGEYRSSQAPVGGEPQFTICSLAALPDILGL